MKIDAYSEQKKAAAAYDEQQKHAAQIKGTVSGAALTQAVTFTKSDGKMELFAASSYADEAAAADKKPKSSEEFADEAQALLDNMKAICNKMDTGEIVAMDEDGVDVNNTDTERIVTVGEQIRIKLAAAGNERVYTGDIDAADLKDVLGEGNAALAARVLEKYNFPVTEDNINEICKAIDKVNELEVPDTQAKSYLMNNNLLPTADNLYKAEHVSGGYHEKMPLSDAEWNEIKPQIEDMLEKADIEVNRENLKEIRELIENGTAVNGRSLEVYRQVSEAGEALYKIGLHNNDTEAEQLNEMIADKMAATMVDGEPASGVNLSDEPVVWKKASECVEILENVSAEALKEFFTNAGYQNNLKGLKQAVDAVGSDGEGKLNPLDYYNLPEDFLSDEKSLHTLKCLEELRLKMTFEAAYILEKNGIDVDTEELSKLVEELSKLDVVKGSADSGANRAADSLGYQKAETDTAVNSDSTDYRKVMYELGALKTAPCAAIGDALQDKELRNEDGMSLADIESSVNKLQRQYKDADAAYETMSTQIRPDLGDKVGKAVEASTDNVLKELELDENDENRRAVRILAYNSMEITRERIEKVKKVDRSVNNILDRMTPDIALDMLRDGSDIMNSDIDELSAELDRRITGRDEMTTQSFAEYLYNENRRGNISGEERTEYMALYSIVNKLAKDDGKAVGQLVNQNMDATIGNLVTSYMISGAAGIDASASDEGSSYDNGGGHNNEKLGYYKDMLEKLAQLPKEAARMVTDNELPHTINNLAAAGALYEDNAYLYKELKKSDVNARLDRFIENMDSKKELLADYDELSEQLKEAVNSAAEDGRTADIGLLRQLSASMSVIDSLAKHNTFYVPYDSDSGTGAIRLSVIEDSDSAGSFTVDMDAEDEGHISVNARVQGDSITAYVLSKNDCGEALAQVEKELSALGFSSVRLSQASSDGMGAVHSGKPGKAETRKLFAAAKVFVEKLR